LMKSLLINEIPKSLVEIRSPLKFSPGYARPMFICNEGLDCEYEMSEYAAINTKARSSIFFFNNE